MTGNSGECDVSGDFEIHLTVRESHVGSLAAFTQRNGLTYVEIVLDRGQQVRQPMATARCGGTLAEALTVARNWRDAMRLAGLDVRRTKVEAAPWNTGVPQADADAAADPDERYFEHHVKLLLPDATPERLAGLTDLATPHEARLSRNARRVRGDGREERYVTQRCRRVGQGTARERLEALLLALRGAGHEVIEVEEEYVVSDDAVGLDSGWLEPTEGGMSATAAGPADRAAHRAAMYHLLEVVATAPWGADLILRGSMSLRAWLKGAAREPQDLDFVVLPYPLEPVAAYAARTVDRLVAAVRNSPACGLLPDLVVVSGSDYEGYDNECDDEELGRRLVFPFVAAGDRTGEVRVDLTFGRHPAVPPVAVRIPPLDVPILAATPEQSLAWKLRWLCTDAEPRAKDLYDATLLAEYIDDDPAGLVGTALCEEWSPDADRCDPRSLSDRPVDWERFREQHPEVQGDIDSWKDRFDRALAGILRPHP